MPIKRNIDSYFDIIAPNKNQEETKFKKKSYAVEKSFKPVYKDGQFEVVLRFLPSCKEEFRPFVENRSHFIRGKSTSGEFKVFPVNCLSKYGKPCPICDYNREVFKKVGKIDYRNHSLGKANKKYISNVLVVRNDNAPDTEGQIFRFEFGIMFHNLISNIMSNREDLELGTIKGINPFDYIDGANFIFKGSKESNDAIPNYKESSFGIQRRINHWNRDLKKYVEYTDEEIEEIDNNLLTLEEWDIKEEDVSTYEQVLESYEKIFGKSLFGGVTVSPATNESPLNPFNDNKTSTPKRTTINERTDINEVSSTKAEKKVKEPKQVDDIDSLFANLSK